MPRNGIVHTGGSDRDREYLLLEEMRAKVLIVDIAARVTLTQKYRNPSSNATGRAVYYFPVPASGAVCAFEMRTSDGRVVTATCKEKSKAREEYEQALSEGKESSLLDWVSDDIFTISVGSIPASSTVEIKLVFAMTLPNDDNADEIRFQLPMCVGERYGPALPSLEGAAAPTSATRIRMSIDIQTSGRIQSITSPSHTDKISETKYPTHLGRPSRRRSTVKFRSSAFLEQDFILIVRADGLDSPRCFAELQRDPTGKHSDTLAMQFTLVPNFKLPPVAGQEYIFVVDRSGSMAGARIETAKSTLGLLLRMLPARGSTFNIFSFGSKHDSLWPRSVAYNHDSLVAASAHVASMAANYGGTEIRSALRSVFGTRDRTTAVFVLTDGDVSDPDSTISEIQNAVLSSVQGHRLRVFCLGIGDGVSSAMCEGIARAGDGICLFSVQTESILGKCASLFASGRTPFVEHVTIDWGVSEALSTVTVNFSTPPSSAHKVRLRPAPAVQQSPASIKNIHAGARMNVYAILTLRNAIVPKVVKLRGQLDGGGDLFELEVPLRSVQLTDSEPGLPLVHTLAAWRLIQDHQERTAPLALTVSAASEEETRKASIIRLGERYQVASRYTSFVAVDSGRGRARRASSSGPTTIPDADAIRSSHADSPNSGLGSFISSFFSSSPITSPARTEFPGAWPEAASTSAHEVGAHDENDDEGYQSVETFSTLSSLDGSSDSEWSDWSDVAPPVSEEDARMQRSPSPKLESLQLAPHSIREARKIRMRQAAPEPRAPPPPVHPEVIALASLQLFDGSFDASIRGIVGSLVFDEATVLRVDPVVWATAVSIAFMGKHLTDPAQKELLEELQRKAYEFLDQKSDVQARRLVDRAKELV